MQSITKRKVRSVTKKVSNKNGKHLFRQTITPERKEVLIVLPSKLVGKEIELIAVEAEDHSKLVKRERVISKEKFWETFGIGKLSQIDSKQIRKNAWRKIEW